LRLIKKIFSILAALSIALTFAVPAFAKADTELDEALDISARYMLKAASSPVHGEIGGDWAVIGLARSGYPVPQEYWDNYYATVEKNVRESGGILHEKKYTDYSRTILALTAIGADPTNVAGYNLLYPLGDFEKTIWQGINGAIWALIALDSNNYEIPENTEASKQASRGLYVDEILSRQLDDGGWNLSGKGSADPDVTGMALQALSKYCDQKEVKNAVDRALTCISDMQMNDGGFESYGVSSAESVAQVIVALCELGISLDDSRFVKNGITLVDRLLDYRLAEGGFFHTEESIACDQMASEQALYALAAAARAADGRNSLYRMSDCTISVSGMERNGFGLPNRHEDIRKTDITVPDATFDDISGHGAKTAIEALAARGIINGMTDELFAPDDTMTRAQFAAIVVRALGLEPVGSGKHFEDVSSEKWYYSFVLTAGTYGIIEGRSDTQFCPEDTITRQEAAVMVSRAAALCGMDTTMSNSAVRDTLAQFGDYKSVSDWAASALAFCYDENILDQSELNIQPRNNILRCEIAQMLYSMLEAAKLI